MSSVKKSTYQTGVTKKVFQLTDTLSAYYRNETYSDGAPAQEIFGFINTSDVDDIMKNGATEEKYFLNYILQITKKGLDTLLNKGYMKFQENYTEYTYDTQLRPRDYFEKLTNGTISLSQLYKDDYEYDMIFTLDGKPVPQLLFVDYIGGITNDVYDLPLVLSHLKENKSVKGLNGGKIKITDIPYYNADEERNKAIEFSFIPSPEQMQQVWDAYQSQDRDEIVSSINEIIFELDLLDIKKFLKEENKETFTM